jgi:hypothetical protein
MQTDTGKAPILLQKTLCMSESTNGQATKWRFEEQMPFLWNCFKAREWVMVIKIKHACK